MLLPITITLLKALRRAIRRINRGLFIVADTFSEAMHDFRASKRKYPFAE